MLPIPCVEISGDLHVDFHGMGVVRTLALRILQHNQNRLQRSSCLALEWQSFLELEIWLPGFTDHSFFILFPSFPIFPHFSRAKAPQHPPLPPSIHCKH